MEKIIITEKGYLLSEVPMAIYNELLAGLNINDVKSKKPYNFTLAGNIEKELEVTNLVPNSFYEYVASLANNYYAQFPKEALRVNKQFEFIDAWLNYQKRLEFNPLHIHKGTLSYVVWIKIPYNIHSEMNMPNNLQTNLPRNSFFEFMVDNISHPIQVDSSYEGKIIIFNSLYHHQVYPFYTSNDYRISLAGNLNTYWVD